MVRGPIEQLLLSRRFWIVRSVLTLSSLISCIIVFRTILKKYNLAAGDFPDLTSFSAKLKEAKFSEFSALRQEKIDELDHVLNVEIPALMAVRNKQTILEYRTVWLLHVKPHSLKFINGSALPKGVTKRTRFARVTACQAFCIP
jgi:Domain of unknown function (DUF5600)